jgi:hypothetical protein
MEHQSLLHKKLLDKVFVFTAETTPPDAADKETLLKNVMPLKDIADASGGVVSAVNTKTLSNNFL